MWVANRQDATVSRIDPATDVVTGLTRVGRDPRAIAAGNGAVWVVANAGDATVTRIDPATRRPTATNYTDDDRRHVAHLVNVGLVHDAGCQLEISAELMENLGLRHPRGQAGDATDMRMTESADVSMTEPLISQ